MKIGIGKKGRTKTEGEKPFWISYADLMSALMALFLVVMVASLVKQVGERNSKENRHKKDSEELCQDIKVAAEFLNNNQRQTTNTEGTDIVVDCINRSIRIDGQEYQTEQYKLKQTELTRLFQLIPRVLDLANDSRGKRVLKRITVEGHASPKGEYLYNLDLSIKRSHWFICQLLDDESPLPTNQKRIARSLFFIGGQSFINSTNTEALDTNVIKDQRIELKLEFNGVNDTTNSFVENEKILDIPSGSCRLD